MCHITYYSIAAAGGINVTTFHTNKQILHGYTECEYRKLGSNSGESCDLDAYLFGDTQKGLVMTTYCFLTTSTRPTRLQREYYTNTPTCISPHDGFKFLFQVVAFMFNSLLCTLRTPAPLPSYLVYDVFASLLDLLICPLSADTQVCYYLPRHRP